MKPAAGYEGLEGGGIPLFIPLFLSPSRTGNHARWNAFSSLSNQKTLQGIKRGAKGTCGKKRFFESSRDKKKKNSPLTQTGRRSVFLRRRSLKRVHLHSILTFPLFPAAAVFKTLGWERKQRTESWFGIKARRKKSCFVPRITPWRRYEISI